MAANELTQLRASAASDWAWTEERMAIYKADGAKPPEAISRLGALSRLLLDSIPSLEALRQTSAEDARLRKVGDRLADVRASIDSLLIEVNGSQQSASSSVALAPVPASEEAKAVEPPTSTAPASSPSPASVPSAGEGATSGLWPASGLFHGLVLRNAKGEERLFGEPARGQYSVQTVAPDRKTAGEPWSTMPEAWPADVWSEAPPVAFETARPKYDAPIKGAQKQSAVARTLALPGLADVAPKTIPLVRDFAPDDSQFAAWRDGLKRHTKRDIDEGQVRTCFVNWQVEHCNEAVDNPKAAFWAHAKVAFAPVVQPAA